MARLTEEEAHQFVSDVLKLASSRERLLDDRVAFLNAIVSAYSREVPFQNIGLLCQTQAERHRPTWEEIKRAVVSGRGGLCYTIAVFMKCLLEALGYSVHYLASSVFQEGLPEAGHPVNHIVTVVQDLTALGSQHLVDFMGHPMFEAIPLNFAADSPTYRHSYLTYKFIREGEGSIVRLHKHKPTRDDSKVTCQTDHSEDKKWRRVCVYDLTPRDLAYFDHSMHEVYTTPGKRTGFFTCFRAVRFMGPNLKCVAIKDTVLLHERDDHILKDTKLNSLTELLETCKDYFSHFSSEDVTCAVTSVGLFK